MALSIISIVLSLAAIVYSVHLAVVYNRFNDGIKDWANALDESTRFAIDQQAMRILQEMDERITSQKNQENQENQELLNINQDEQD